MRRQRRSPVLVLVAVVAVIAGLLWWLSRANDAPRADEMPIESGNATAAVTPPVVDLAQSPTSADATVERTDATPTPQPTTATPTGTAIIRGRCVDVRGAPLAGARANLNGNIANSQRLELHRREHGPVEWRNPPIQTTGGDGRFEFEFVPPPPCYFFVVLTADGLVSMEASWNTLAPGTVVDLGDVVFRAGVVVRGRVVDTDDKPVANVMVSLSRQGESDENRAVPRTHDRATSDQNGAFAMSQPLLPGKWTCEVHGAALVEPAMRNLTLTPPEHVFDIVVVAESAMTSIEGILVDTAGVPLTRATVAARADTVERLHQGHPKADGTFAIRAEIANVGTTPFALTVDAEGFELLETEPIHRFGAKDLRLVVTRCPTLDVVVRRDDDGAAVEHFAVRMLPTSREQLQRLSNAYSVHGGFQHANGIARLTDIRRGAYLMSVEPATTTGLAGVHFVPTNVGDGAPSTVEVRLQVPVARRVVVERADGTPVAGSAVELIQAPDGDAVTVVSPARTWEDWMQGIVHQVLRVDAATTAADGSCEVRGAPAAKYWVRVRGAEHLPVVVGDVRVAVDEPLRIVVAAGGKIVGRLTPADVVSALRVAAGRSRPYSEPAVTLARQVASVSERVPIGEASDGARIADDGTFVIGGIPPGTWNVSLYSFAGGSGSLTTLASELAIADGETKTLTFDISARRPGRLRAAVWLDGEPFVGDVSLRQPGVSSRSAKTGADGRLDVWLGAGRWEVRLIRFEPPTGYVRFAVPEIAAIAPGGETDAVFRATSVRKKVRVVRADGSPAAGVSVTFDFGQARGAAFTATTSEDGLLDVWASPGTYQATAFVPGPTGQLVGATIGSVTWPLADELRLP